MKTSPNRKTFAAIALLTLGTMMPVAAATFTVTNTNDTGPGSLRQAVLDANASAVADTIVFDPNVFSSPQTITVATELRISANANTVDTLTIVGPGASLLTISGNGTSRIFVTGVNANDTTSISGMTLTKGGGNNGGAISNGGITTLTDMVFFENVTNSGGALYNSGNGTTSGVLNIVGCTFTNNQTTGTNINGDGGSALENNSTGKVTITNCTMSGGTTRGGGGAIRNEGTMDISDTIIENHTSGGSGNSDGGGAIRSSGQLTMTNCIVRGNKAGEGTSGGGIRNENQLTLINTIVTGNSAEGNGGGVYEGAGAGGSSDFLKITNSTISNNVANTIRDNSGAGGGIYDEGGDVTIIGSTISGNQVLITATPTDSTVSDGGGIWSDGKVALDRSTISGNTAGRGFGGLRVAHVFHDSTVTNSTIVGNSAPSGGGFGKVDCNLSCRTITIGNTIVSGNVGGDVRSGGPGGADSNDAPIMSLGYNLIGTFAAGTLYTSSSSDLIGVDPKLGPLQDNGGPTFTHAPQPGSPVADKGKRLSEATIDQRGVNRPFDDPNIANASGGDGSEIGAFEFGEALVAQEKTLGNIATRLPVGTGENVIIGGFIVVGDAPKRMILRGRGPSLAQEGVAGVLEDPVLELYQGDTLLGESDDWRQHPTANELPPGFGPTDDREAAFVITLEPGAYTGILRGKDGTTGIGIVEAYDFSQAQNSKLANISTRGVCGSGDNVMIAGFIAGPRTRVVVRGVGPSLGGAGIQGALQDPTLQLVNASGEVVRSNDNWRGVQRQEIEALGIQPSDDREATLIATLPAGNYTAVMAGVGGNSGVGLVEVYNLP